MKRCSIALFLLFSFVLNARTIHARGDIWVGWRGGPGIHPEDILYDTTTKGDLDLLNHTAIDIGNYKTDYGVITESTAEYSQTPRDIDVTIGAEGGAGCVAYRAVHSWYRAWSSEGTNGEHHIDIWSLSQIIGDHVAVAERWLGRPYKFTTLWDTTSFYCHKLVWWAFRLGKNIEFPYEYLPDWRMDFVTAHDLTYDAQDAGLPMYLIYEDYVPHVIIKKTSIPSLQPIGCPYLWVEKEGEWIRDNTILPGSPYREDDTEDHYILTVTPSFENNCRIKIAEEEHEETRLDRIELFAVYYPETLGLITMDGNYLCYDTVRIPLRAVDNEGNDCTDLLAKKDGRAWEGETGDWLDITFENEWVAKALIFDLPSKHDGIVGMEIDTFFWTFDGRGIASAGVLEVSRITEDTFTVRLYCGGNLSLDYLNCVRIVPADVRVEKLELLESVHSRYGDVKESLEEKDGDYVKIKPTHELECVFDKPSPPPSGYALSFVLVSCGRYSTVNAKLPLVEVFEEVGSKLANGEISQRERRHLEKAKDNLFEVLRYCWWSDNYHLSDTSYVFFERLSQAEKHLEHVQNTRGMCEKLVEVAEILSLVSMVDAGEIPVCVSRLVDNAYKHWERGNLHTAIVNFGEAWRRLSFSPCTKRTIVQTKKENRKVREESFWVSPVLRDRGYIKLVLSREKNCRISVYRVDGRLVKNVFEGRLSAGSHEFMLWKEDYSSGVFFVRVEKEGKIFTKPFMVIK